ncbi:DUF805 domain-containing protein [Ligilactobacillus saerimneri]|uniref:DZANK-type domain-containing protein n=1 Tax=Ligilactobacillus saerimneri 30a TaxID=1227363 RepID=M5J471_9LACO|nr:DUF805 domain-containing protein [Ligilactobacillus saerimneri]EKW98833.1 hypothetical protein D271_04810 [Ligilactobacillus saerimneri 30a]KRL72740.1 hypothetical protein FC54_GL000988 [Ligilactobacillus saerimneri DSM 16049]MBU5310317.1 zinc-ribbon domain-containing protein [Ligilactobacillus saerimneri]MCZ0891393.1 zinc-ribbon domain-containing protein [Ligilactobacillus saerimneri]MDI9206518.1 zinc-ribbon domain-containing protein [Ligilactobacillus saerimneri]
MYCQKCGHQLDDNQQQCAFCGTVQELGQPNIETKKCKKCERDIPVNANYCSYCGMDQALIVWKERPQDEPEPEKTIAGLDDASNSELNNLVANMKKAGIEVRVIKRDPKDLPPHKRPGLINSTRRLLRDSFKVQGRMGLADYWWGYLGMVILLLVVIELLMSFVKNTTLLELLLLVTTVVYFVPTFTASIRRFRDAGVPVGYMILRFIPFVGELIIWFFALRPSLEVRQQMEKEIERQLEQLKRQYDEQNHEHKDEQDAQDDKSDDDDKHHQDQP